jgi:hypothetical protein
VIEIRACRQRTGEERTSLTWQATCANVSSGFLKAFGQFASAPRSRMKSFFGGCIKNALQSAPSLSQPLT